MPATASLYYHCASLIGLGHLAPALSLAIMLAALTAVLAVIRFSPAYRMLRR